MALELTKFIQIGSAISNRRLVLILLTKNTTIDLRMKFAILLFAVFAAPSSRSLKGDLDDFLAIIPKLMRESRSWRDFLDETKKIVDTDKITSVEYQKLHDDALAQPKIADLIQRLTDLGVDIKGG
ncbi:hypothetical protein CBL_03318 [Carabus blaptoides fortunei]